MNHKLIALHPTPGELAEQRHLVDPLDHEFEHLADERPTTCGQDLGPGYLCQRAPRHTGDCEPTPDPAPRCTCARAWNLHSRDCALYTPGHELINARAAADAEATHWKRLGMTAPLSPAREAAIVARLDDEDRTAGELTDIVTELLTEVNRLRNETAGLRQGSERQKARTDHIAKQALRWKAEADGRKKYGEKLRAELAALPAPVVGTAWRDGLGNVWPLGHFPVATKALVLKTNPTVQRTVRYGAWTEVTA